MSKGDVNFSTDNEYYTPKQIVDMFGHFEYDPATTPEKSKDLGIENYDTIETDAPKSDWTIDNLVQSTIHDQTRVPQKGSGILRQNGGGGMSIC